MSQEAHRDDRALMGWLVGAGYALAGALGLLAAALPGDEVKDEGAVVVISSAALAAGAAISHLRRTLPPIAYRGLVLVGIGAVTVSFSRSGDLRTDIELFYVYPLLFAFFFFRWWEAAAIWALTVVLYALVAHDLDPTEPAGRIAIFAALVGGNGVVLGLLRDRSRRSLDALGESANTDPLTGLLNRRGFQLAGARGLEEASARGLPYSLVMLDLDDFKQVNDELGHLGGDMTLERVASVMARTKRLDDMTARMGGEEFAVLLPGADTEQALVIAERMRAAIQEDLAGSSAPITCSVGVASFPEHGRTLELLMRVADRALYAAKAAGKNRTVLYDDELRGPGHPAAAGPEMPPLRR